MTAELMEQIAKDVREIKERMRKIEITVEEIDADLHEVNPEYIGKLKRIEKEGTVSQKEFEEKFGVKV